MTLAIDPAAVERLIRDLGAIGAHSGTGVWRPVSSPEWVAATAFLFRTFAEAGLTPRQDTVGNVWGRLEGREGGKSIVSGSHVDSQCPGGRYDGALGIIAALVAVTALRERYGIPRRTIEVLSLCEEEGSRFPANFWGSRAITGNIAAGEADNIVDADGATIGAAMQAVGLTPERIAESKRDDIDSFVELHIEQGPILEHAGLSVGVVDAITGPRHTEVRLTGLQNHAGAFPMDLRKDPMAGFAEIAGSLIAMAERMGRPAVTTIGRCVVYPNAGAVIPRSVTFTIDARHPDPAARQHMYALQDALVREVAERRGLGLETLVLIEKEPCLSTPELVATIRKAAETEGIATLTMASGAGHDTQQMAAIAKVAMIFVRSKEGRSHTPEEFSSIADIVDGIRVLAETLRLLAYDA